jgi:glyoxylase-like metal-dependent hydrolase (beta-lactamase superfamily II)
MAKWQYTKGLHDLGGGCWAYLQPDGSWGWSNAGLVVDGRRTLLIDTLFDLKLTREMLETMRRSVPAAARIDTLVNTHVNGDHTHGNQLVVGAEIVGTHTLLEEMQALPPERLAALFQNWRALGAGGTFLHETMGSRFDFSGIVLTPPTRLFDGELTLKVGDKEVRLIDLGPAHTKSDVVAYLPAERTLFTGDLLFNGGHPAVWAGPVRNWIAACERMLSWDLETVVPGHGPVTDKSAIRRLRDYFVELSAETRRRFDAGLSVEEAARDIAEKLFGSWAFRDWIDEERIFINVNALYRDFRGGADSLDLTGGEALEVWNMMGRFYEERKARTRQ